MSEKKQQVSENKQNIAIGSVAVAALVVVLISVLALKVAVVPACVILLLQAGIAACLDNEPVWLHGLVLLIEVIAGILAGQIIFMILIVLIYIATLYALKFWKEA